MIARHSTNRLRRIIRLLEKVGLHLKQQGWGNYEVGRSIIDVLLFLSDVNKVQKTYKAEFGTAPRLLRPHTFNEKLQRMKLLGRKPHHTLFADKIAVRDYVREKIGSEFLAKMYWTGYDLADARRHALPDRFVIKANHNSGCNLFVTDAAAFDWGEASKLTREWLERDRSVIFAEWQYRWIPPSLLIEEYLRGPDGSVPLDYKFFCFNGRVEMVQVDFDRFANHTRALFDRDFNRLPVGFKYPRYHGSVARPSCFEQMREIAECLAAGESFLRVDLYDVGRPVFGELTLHPEAGLGRFDPGVWDERLGALL